MAPAQVMQFVTLQPALMQLRELADNEKPVAQARHWVVLQLLQLTPYVLEQEMHEVLVPLVPLVPLLPFAEGT